MEKENFKVAKEKEFDLGNEVYRMLQDEPFFAALSRRIEKSPCKSIPTAGVRVNKDSGNFQLLYNPEFFTKLTTEEKQDVLKHEYYHLILEHVTGRLPGDHGNPGMNILWNYATDLSINGFLPHIPKNCLIPGKGEFKDYPPGQSAEWYYKKIKEDEKFQITTISIQFDDHSGWSNENKPSEGNIAQDAANDMAKEKLKEILKKATKECAQNSSWGTISDSLKKEIIARLSSTVDWRNILRYFIKTSQKASKNNSIRKINKRYPYIHAGKKTLRQAKIAISIDQSGSVGDELLASFFTELDKLAEIATFTVVPFDSEVDESKIFVWKKGERKKWERVLCGGTDFNSPTKYVNSKNFDGHIILTDLCAPKPIKSVCQRLWMTDQRNYEQPYFQTNEIIVPIKNKTT